MSLNPFARLTRHCKEDQTGETIVNRFDSTVDHDTPVGILYALFDVAHRDRVTTRIAGVLRQARQEVQMRELCHFFRADEDYGRRVAGKLGIDIDAVLGTTAPV